MASELASQTRWSNNAKLASSVAPGNSSPPNCIKPVVRPTTLTASMQSATRKSMDAENNCTPTGNAAKTSNACPKARNALTARMAVENNFESTASTMISPVLVTEGTSNPRPEQSATNKTSVNTAAVATKRPNHAMKSGSAPVACTRANPDSSS